MSTLTNLTYGGKVWTPQFVQEINQNKCIGCGRCFKACGRDVLSLRALNYDDRKSRSMYWLPSLFSCLSKKLLYSSLT